MSSILSEARTRFHERLITDETLSFSDSGVASNADGGQALSKMLASHIALALGARVRARKLDGQSAGKNFESAVAQFLRQTFPLLGGIRPGEWRVENVGGSRAEYHVARYEPYTHLGELKDAIERDSMLAAVLGNTYEISPDVLIVREPISDSEINATSDLVDNTFAKYTPIRSQNNSTAIVHGVVSCKWTLRSDRAQNARSEALNMIRNRKGRTPHIAVVTGEPIPARLSSLALGTGDIDTVYHFALPELIDAVDTHGTHKTRAQLNVLINGKRLRDISDLPFDLAI